MSGRHEFQIQLLFKHNDEEFLFLYFQGVAHSLGCYMVIDAERESFHSLNFDIKGSIKCISTTFTLQKMVSKWFWEKNILDFIRAFVLNSS